MIKLSILAGSLSLVTATIDFVNGHVGWGILMLVMAGWNFQTVLKGK